MSRTTPYTYGGPIAGTAACDGFRLVVYADFFNRHAAKPARPEPRRRRDAGSGTGAIGVAVPIIWTRSAVGPPPLFTSNQRVFTPPFKYALLTVKGEKPSENEV